MIVNRAYPKNKIKGIIFDLDGTLINSESNYYESEKILLARYGFDLTYEIKKDYIGIGDYQFVTKMKERFDINEPTKYLLAEKQKMYLELAKKNTAVFPVMDRLVKLLHVKNYPLAIATGSSKEIINILMESIEIKDLFSYIVSSDEVKNGKPFPDVFLETAKRMNIQAENILVFEDSKNGVQSAISAGMSCIATPEPQDDLPDIFYKAEILFNEGISTFDVDYVINWLVK